MEILFVSDYVCPYCLVAKEALRLALEETGLEARITWQPFELTRAPSPRVDTWSDPVRREHYKVLEAPCEAMELPMKLPPRVIPRPYSTLAFQGWHYACRHGKGDAYNDLVYRAYFLEEQDIGDLAVLTSLAVRAGLDGADFALALERGDFAQAQKEAADYARDVLKPRGVPTIYMDGEKVELQTYTKEEMVRLLTDRAGQAPGFCCGEDGCG